MAINLAGDADFINVGTMGNFGTGLDTNFFIYSLWFNSSNTTSHMCIAGMVSTGNNTVLQFHLNTTDSSDVNAHDIFFFRRDEDGEARFGFVSKAGGVTDGNWHNLIISSGHTSTTIWLDGVSQAITDSSTDIVDNMANFEFAMTIGARNLRDVFDDIYTGKMSDAAMWSTATQLTQAEVDNLNSQVKGMPLQIRPSDLALYLPLDDLPNGTVINTETFVDQSGTGNDGTGVDIDDDSTCIAEEVLSYPPNVIIPEITGVVVPTIKRRFRSMMGVGR